MALQCNRKKERNGGLHREQEEEEEEVKIAVWFSYKIVHLQYISRSIGVYQKEKERGKFGEITA